jgi:hypothetical protein
MSIITEPLELGVWRYTINTLRILYEIILIVTNMMRVQDGEFNLYLAR